MCMKLSLRDLNFSPYLSYPTSTYTCANELVVKGNKY